ncbi:MAG: hypothetical protein M3R63_07205 [Actinomycetota bacterium]|nr:hypothetical protein [Actinomycetota bacterium]
MGEFGQLRGGLEHFMYHRHGSEHQYENMMRPRAVLSPEVMAVDPHEQQSHDSPG